MAATSFFAYAVEKPKTRHPPHGVINEELIKAAIDEERALLEEEAAHAADNAGSSTAQMSVKDLEAQLGRHPAFEDATHDKLKSLTLSFRSLAAIANLENLVGLETLRLDNNSIRVIEGLSGLTRLTWLDLSFNEIERIEGLSTLHKLTDLSLANNRISSLDGLSQCTSLSFLSLANNRVAEVEQAAKLRSLPKLRALAVSGNDFCNDEDDYEARVLMWLPHLQWIDFAAVGPAERQAALDAEAQLPDAVLSQEKAEAAAAVVRAKEEERRRKHEAQGLHHLAGLWGRMSGRGAPPPLSSSSRAGRQRGAGDDDEDDADDDDDDDESDADETAAGGMAGATEEAEMEERVLRLPGVRAKWAAYARVVRDIVDRGLQRAGAIAVRAAAEAEAADSALEALRAQAAVTATERLSSFLRRLKQLRRRLEAGAELRRAAEEDDDDDAFGDRSAAARDAEARAALNLPAGAGEPLAATGAARALAELAHENDSMREELLVWELQAHEQAVRVLEAFDSTHGGLSAEQAGCVDAVLREVEVEEKRFAEEVRGHVLAMVERVGSGEPILADVDSLSLESIKDGATLSKFGVLASRQRPEIPEQDAAAADGTGGADHQDALDSRTAALSSSSSSEVLSSSSASSGAGGSKPGGGETGRVPVHAEDLCQDLAALLSDKELAASALGDAEAGRMEQLLAVVDASKAWFNENKLRESSVRQAKELKANRERCEEIAAVWEANKEEIDNLRSM